MNQPSERKREIIINKMYIGAYLLEGDNIGHEIINLYKADDGKNYIYLNSQGTIDLSHKNKIITILLVRRFDSNIYKILAKAEGVTILDFASNRLPRLERYKKQVKLGLTYSNVELVDLFGNNSFKGTKEEAKNVFTTFVADKVVKPNKELYITDLKELADDEIYYIRTKKGFGKSTLREYYEENQKRESFLDLNNIIENEKLWEKENSTKKVLDDDYTQIKSDYNFLKLIKQEDNEHVFTNMFVYFFLANQDSFMKFAKEVLKVNIERDYLVEREKKNIDLLVTDNNKVLVIENKIKSSINGVDERHYIYGERIQSQLKKYYDYVTEDKNYKDKTPHCFIFSPNYNRIDLDKFTCGDKYTIIYYNEIYNFFIRNKESYKDEKYFDEFVKSMYKHTKDYDNELEEEMQRRFFARIHKIKTNKNSINI